MNKEVEVVDLGVIEFIHQMVKELKDHEVDMNQFQEVVVGVCDSFVKNMIKNNEVEEFLKFNADQVHESFMKIYVSMPFGKRRLADQFATDCVLYICAKLSKLERQVH